MSKWRIVMQEEKAGKNTVEVACKNVKMFPKYSQGVLQGFGRLGFLLLQVIVEDDEGTQAKLKMSTSQGINCPSFVVQWPDTMARPLITVGEGRRKQTITDVLSDPVKKDGEKERYDSVKGFTARLERMLGAGMAGTVLQLFADRFAKLAA
jgi:hypothetical protein